MRNRLKKSLWNIKRLFTQRKRNLGDINMKGMINVCFLRKAFVLNHSLCHSKCTGGPENYKCLMNCKINTKVKSCTNCWIDLTGLLQGRDALSLSLFGSFILVEQETPLFDSPIEAHEKKSREGKWETRPLWWCPQLKTALKLPTKHRFSSRNNSWEQRATFPIGAFK